MTFSVAFLYDYLDRGGVEKHLYQLIKFLSENHVACHIIAETSDYFRQKIGEFDIQVHPLPKSNSGVRNIADLSRLMKKENIDILHIHHSKVSIIGRIAALIAKTKSIVTVHLNPKDYLSSPSFSKTTKLWLFTQIDKMLNWWITDRLIFVSTSVYQYYVSKKLAPANRSRVITNGIDLKLYQNPESGDKLRSAIGVLEDEVVLMFLGRLEEQKGPDILLEAFHEIEKDLGNIKLLIVGEGPQKDKLLQQAEVAGVLDHVKFLGWREDIPDLLNTADVFILPSRYEAFPYVLLEAMASGLPCIASGVGDIPLIIQPDLNGILVPPNDAKALSKTIQLLIQNETLRRELGKTAREAVKKYPLAIALHQMMETYLEVI